LDELEECASDVRRDVDEVIVVDLTIEGDVGTHRSAQLLVRFSGLGLPLHMYNTKTLRAVLNFTPGPQEITSPLGVNLAPRGELGPKG
jgi:hypothetical protein